MSSGAHINDKIITNLFYIYLQSSFVTSEVQFSEQGSVGANLDAPRPMVHQIVSFGSNIKEKIITNLFYI